MAELDGRLWHATSESGWRGILADKAVRADATPEHHNGFCRSIGAISLFDLSLPDTAAPIGAAHWSTWLSFSDWSACYWLEIDRAATAGQVLNPTETKAKWNAAIDAHSPAVRLIAGIEAAHVGAIPLTHIARALKIENRNWIETIRPNQAKPTTGMPE